MPSRRRQQLVMTVAEQLRVFNAICAVFFIPRPTISVSAWCEQNLRFNEPSNTGPFRIAGRDYIREPLNSWNEDDVTDVCVCWGSQTGKTGLIMGGAGFTVVSAPSRFIWVMPSANLGASFSFTRWIPMLRASEVTSVLIPTRSRRNEFKIAEQQIGGSIVGFVGSNSPGNLASNPARVVVLDEVDKFDQGGNGEADAVNLAEQRTKSFANPLRFKTSTPTLVDGLIWGEYLKGDQRRYHMPCPHCSQHVVFGWSAGFTIMARIGCEAWVKWDPAAKRPDGTWNLAQVKSSAYAECPHCQGAIRDHHKADMIERGEWRTTAVGSPGYRSYHLPSMYALGDQTTFGSMAAKFLVAKASILGLQGFINGDLAEPWEGQDIRSERAEIIVSSSNMPSDADGMLVLSIDCQEVAPYFWFILREWWKNGDSILHRFGHVDEWDELRNIQLEHGVDNRRVFVDSKWNTQAVYEQCIKYGEIRPLGVGQRIFSGWFPMRGREADVNWIDPKTKLPKPYMMGFAPLGHSRFRLPLIHLNGDLLKTVLSHLRSGKSQNKWMLTEKVDEVYYKHLDGEVRKAMAHATTGRITYRWVRRSKRWPNHLLDCEVMQICAAVFWKRLNLGESHEPKREAVDQSEGVGDTSGGGSPLGEAERETVGAPAVQG